jgi:hypothetical protein
LAGSADVASEGACAVTSTCAGAGAGAGRPSAAALVQQSRRSCVPVPMQVVVVVVPCCCCWARQTRHVPGAERPRRPGGAHLHAHEKAHGPVAVIHGRQCEHVPEGTALRGAAAAAVVGGGGTGPGAAPACDGPCRRQQASLASAAGARCPGQRLPAPALGSACVRPPSRQPCPPSRAAHRLGVVEHAHGALLALLDRDLDLPHHGAVGARPLQEPARTVWRGAGRRLGGRAGAQGGRRAGGRARRGGQPSGAACPVRASTSAPLLQPQQPPAPGPPAPRPPGP